MPIRWTIYDSWRRAGAVVASTFVSLAQSTISLSAMVLRAMVLSAMALSTMALRTMVLSAMALSTMALSVRASQAQDVRYLVNGDSLSEKLLQFSTLPDSVSTSIQRVIAQLRRRGFHFAALDTISSSGDQTTVRISSGRPVSVNTITINGQSVKDAQDLKSRIQLKEGDPLNMEILEEDLRSFLDHMADAGLHMAVVDIDSVVAVGGDTQRYDVFVGLNPGPLIPVTELLLEGAERTNSRYAARAIDLRLGEIFFGSDLTPYSVRLLDVGLFTSVGDPVLDVYSDSTATIRVPVTEAPPGTFDLVLGYLPPGRLSSSGQLVGSGHLHLLNPFGSGRTIGLRVDRRPGQVSSVDVRASDPQIFGLPILVGGSFRGLQQDSTYNRRSWSAEMGYRLLRGVDILARFTKEHAAPGSAGLKLQAGTQRIPRSEVTFWGLIVNLRRLDNPFNPRSGLSLESLIERGNKIEKSKTITVEEDTTRITRSIRQERLRLTGRGFVRTFRAQTIALGVDVSVLLSDVYDESDLFRIGGANSLRGYDEDQFRASTAIRLLVEYRVLLDALSYVFIFTDVGYIESPQIGDILSTSRWYPGFGLGMRFDTAAGLISASYALNDKEGVTNGRVHLGISFGL